MARTYRKAIRCGICTGSNTEYYRDRNRKARQMNRHNLRNLMAHYDIEDVSNKVTTVRLPHDSWDEPTDGTFLITKRDYDRYKDKNYWNHKFGKYLKPKHNK